MALKHKIPTKLVINKTPSPIYLTQMLAETFWQKQSECLKD